MKVIFGVEVKYFEGAPKSHQQIENYRKAVKQPKMSKSRVKEEMLADAFADMKTGQSAIDKISAKKLKSG